MHSALGPADADVERCGVRYHNEETFMSGIILGHVLPLGERECIPCSGGALPLKGEALAEYRKQLAGDWQVAKEQRLEKDFRFTDFRGALAFTNQVGELAERVSHHPDIRLSWGKVGITLWTHKIGGLSEADFVLAAKIDALPR
jgi:4a-hydroxytetrahydrobiopterin dehydratase